MSEQKDFEAAGGQRGCRECREQRFHALFCDFNKSTHGNNTTSPVFDSEREVVQPSLKGCRECGEVVAHTEKCTVPCGLDKYNYRGRAPVADSERASTSDTQVEAPAEKNRQFVAFGRGYSGDYDSLVEAMEVVRTNGHGAVYVPYQDDYVAYCCYANHGQEEDTGADIITIETCDSGAKGAFRVWASPRADRVEALKKVVAKLARCTCPDAGRYGHYDGPHCNATIARAALAALTEAQ